MIRPGVVLSQPPISTAPSIGWRAQQFLGLHRQEVAIEHGGRLDERLGQRHRRQLERKSARLQHAALHVLGARAQMRVAGVDVAPGVDDADHRLAVPILGVVAELAQPRAMAERAQVLTPSQRWLRSSSGRLRSVIRVRILHLSIHSHSTKGGCLTTFSHLLVSEARFFQNHPACRRSGCRQVLQLGQNLRILRARFTRVDHIDDLARRALGRAEPEKGAGLIARHGFGDSRHVRQFRERRAVVTASGAACRP